MPFVARQIRDMGVYSEIHPHDITPEELGKLENVKGIILNGGENRVVDRLSCWCCPLKNLKELKILYKFYPELWQELKAMDKKSYNQFRADYSVEQLEQKFKKEEDMVNVNN